MAISFGEFIQLLLSSPAIAVTVVLTLGVVLVNGWTDAPNAIATCVSTRSMTPRNADNPSFLAFQEWNLQVDFCYFL